MTRRTKDASKEPGGAATARVNRAAALAHYAPLLPRVRALRAAGHSYQAIADALNGDGLVTREGARYYPSHVGRLLKMG